MDGQRFDKLARLLANGSDRRGFLKRVAGVAAGAAIVTGPGRALAAAQNGVCTDYDPCTGKYEECVYPVALLDEKHYGKREGTCECTDDYTRNGNGVCTPPDGCWTNDDCDTDKHEYCQLPENAYEAGTCECTDGYTYNGDKGYCWADDSVCYANEDCNTEHYGDEDKYVYYNGYYYHKDDYGYGTPLPVYECIYGVCVEVVEETPETPEKPDNGNGGTPPPHNGGNGHGKGPWMKKCIATHRRKIRASGRKVSARQIRNACLKTYTRRAR